MDEIIANIIIPLAILTILGVIGTTGYSVYHSFKKNKRERYENLVPVRMIGIATFGVLVIIALPSLLFGSLSDMCIITIMMMFLIAIGTIVYSRFNTYRLRVKRL